MKYTLTIPLAGHVRKNLVCESFHSSCGQIRNGLSFYFSDGPGNFDGCWVMEFEDLEKLYLAAKHIREKK